MTSRDTRRPPGDDLDPAAVTATCLERVAAASAEDLPAARAVLARLDPGRWAIEWHLPWWLAPALDLDAETALELVVSSVLGLAWVRLGDDLADGEVPSTDAASIHRLRATLYHEATAVYRDRFPPGSAFWTDLERDVAAWRAATDAWRGGDAGHAGGGPDFDAMSLATLGAPARIPGSAACRLAGRDDLVPLVEGCVDHTMSALILFDHANDWQADVRARRPNLLVTAVLGSGAETSPGAADATAIRLAMLLAPGRVAAYFERVVQEAEAARSVAERLRVRPMVAYLDGLADQARRSQADLGRLERAHLTAATTMLWGPGTNLTGGRAGARPLGKEGRMMDPKVEPAATPEQRERLAGKALVDDTFRNWLKADPKGAAAYVGVTLTEHEIERLRKVDWDTFDELAARIQNAAGVQAGGWG